jgi:hypothetical protein
MRHALLGMAVMLSLAACGTATSPAGPPGGTGQTDPLGLVGLWTVRDAAGEEPGTVLRLGDDLTLWKNCGHLNGVWRADASGQFLTWVAGGSGKCFRGGQDVTAAVPDWLAQSGGYRADGADRLLLDRGGRTVARLVAGGRPKVDPDTVASLAEPPVVTAELRRRLAPPRPLPATLRPATAAELVGRWVPADRSGSPRSPRPPSVTFRSDGSWGGSDGCNGQGGAWSVGAAGVLLAGSGPQTLIGCNNVDVGGWLVSAARVGVDGTELVLLDRAGHEVGRLRRG